jgi:hypothetical protein
VPPVPVAWKEYALPLIALGGHKLSILSPEAFAFKAIVTVLDGIVQPVLWSVRVTVKVNVLLPCPMAGVPEIRPVAVFNERP